MNLGSSKLPPIDPIHDLDPILEQENDTDNQHLLPINDISFEEFEILCRRRSDLIEDSSDEDSEWEEMNDSL